MDGQFPQRVPKVVGSFLGMTRMPPHHRIDLRKLLGQRDRPTAGRQISPNRNNTLNASDPSSLQRRGQILLELGEVEVGVCVKKGSHVSAETHAGASGINQAKSTIDPAQPQFRRSPIPVQDF
mgnify:CR=1 FL=1